jgi:hypothetical protein
LAITTAIVPLIPLEDITWVLSLELPPFNRTQGYCD